MGFPGGLVVKNPPAKHEICVWSLGWDNPLEKETAASQSILTWEISMDRGAWQATVQGVTKELDTTQWLNNNLSYSFPYRGLDVPYLFLLLPLVPTCMDQWISNIRVLPDLLEGQLEHRLLDPTPSICDSADLGWSQDLLCLQILRWYWCCWSRDHILYYYYWTKLRTYERYK